MSILIDRADALGTAARLTGGLPRGLPLKSYFLEELDDDVAARKALTDELPGQREPWLPLDSSGRDVIAYFDVDEGREGETRGPFLIQADISGQHY